MGSGDVKWTLRITAQSPEESINILNIKTQAQKTNQLTNTVVTITQLILQAGSLKNTSKVLLI